MTCREYLGKAHGWCKEPPVTAGGWCFEHLAHRQLWEQRMQRGGEN